ncbi:L,D-transpeptidase [Streptomyces sp. NPDC059063]|uniref:L,D-transpeptidase n=1 Tax=unclassified Streptomyces TaxID=2593676 RepID=UPI0036A2D638
MSDEPSSRELSAALRGLAESGRVAAPSSGADVRRRAVGRRRRRRVGALGGAVVACGALVFGLTVGLGDGSDGRPSRPAAPAVSSPGAVGTVDLAQRVLALRGREVPVSSGRVGHPTVSGRMTVVAKYRTKRFSSESVGLGSEYDVTLPWVVELRAGDGRVNYLVALTYAEKSVGEADTTRGWIGMRSRDAKWVYGELELGAVVEVEGRAPEGAG